MATSIKHRSVFKSVARLASLVIALAVVAAALVAPTASAQLRTLPKDIERGHIRPLQHNVVAIDGRQVRLAPGATIRDRRNLIIFANALPEGGASAAYLTDLNGQVWRVWLLTPEEQARNRPAK
jgi:hypothetical protein